ncbi:MAG: DNA polymerase III subunit delta [Chloroflexi bacterium]|nr:DNA polymerase III subunit delta [Chloroflexota bacterium]
MIYLIHGEEEFLRSRHLAEIRGRIGQPDLIDLNTAELDGARLTLGELRDAADVIPFLTQRRLVIVRDLLRAVQAGSPISPDALTEYLDHVPETTDLVLLETRAAPAKHPVVRHLSALAEEGKAQVILCAVPGPRALPAWIRQRAKEKGGEISPRAAALLANAVGQNLRLLDTELDKLIAYAGDGRPIEPADVETMVPYTQEIKVFALTNAIGERRARAAFNHLQQLRSAGETAPQLLAMITRQFRILLQVTELSRTGLTDRQIASELRLRDFMVEQARRQMRHWTLSEITAAFDLLLETDVAIKTGQLDPDTALDLLLVDLLRRSRPSKRAPMPDVVATRPPRSSPSR